MAYSQFTLKKVVDDFNLTLIEQGFLAPVQSVSLSPYLNEFLTKNLQLAIALNTEKARSELLICPLLLAVKEALSEYLLPPCEPMLGRLVQMVQGGTASAD